MSDDIYQLLRRRRMVRAYQARSVPRAVLLRILEAARKTPSAGHAQGVRLAVLEEASSRERVAQLVGEPAFVERGFPRWFGSAPVHLVVATDPQAYHERYQEADKTGGPEQWPVPYGVLDGGQALMALYLCAEAEGLSCGYLGPHSCPDDLLEELSLPSRWRLLGLVSLGYADCGKDRSSRSHRRGWRSFDEVVRWL